MHFLETQGQPCLLEVSAIVLDLECPPETHVGFLLFDWLEFFVLLSWGVCVCVCACFLKCWGLNSGPWY